MKNPWSKSAIFSAFIILVIVFTFVMINSYYTVSSDGRFVKHPTCYDSDGLNFYKKGVVVVTIYEDCEQGCRSVKEDECDADRIVEYFCDDGAFSTVVFCNCSNGRCV